MLAWRAKRYLIILLILATPLVAAGIFLAIRFFPEPSCLDNKRNQGETAVDCGGPCVPCEIKNPRSINVFWTRAIPVRENVYDVVALIQNPNEVTSSGKMEYEFSLMDEAGVVAKRSGRTFIYAQERMYAVEANVIVTRRPSRVEFKTGKISWRINKGDRPNLIVEKRDYKVVTAGGIKESVVESSILNRSPYDFKEVEVRFVVFDRQGNAIGANRVVLERVLAGSSRPVKSIWPRELEGEVGAIEVEPRVNIFDPAIILKPQ